MLLILNAEFISVARRSFSLLDDRLSGSASGADFIVHGLSDRRDAAH